MSYEELEFLLEIFSLTCKSGCFVIIYKGLITAESEASDNQCKNDHQNSHLNRLAVCILGLSCILHHRMFVSNIYYLY